MACKYSFMLTAKDECVPEDYIGIFEIFSDSKYALPSCDKNTWCIGRKRIKELRYDTYRDVRKRFDLCKAENFAKFWNGNLDAINDLGINRFSNFPFFKDLSSVMICFQVTETNPKSGIKRKSISWGIKRDIYRKYYKEQRLALEQNKTLEPANLYDFHKSRNGNVFKLPDAKFEFDSYSNSKQIIKVKKNALYNQFEFWCKAKNISKKDGIYKAMEELIKNNPIEDLKSVGAYQRKCDLDYVEVLLPERPKENMVSSTISTPKSIHMKMREIIERYNKDPDNIGKPRMNISKYIAQAIDLLNRKSPLKYSDPEAYQQYIKSKIAEQYNSVVSEL